MQNVVKIDDRYTVAKFAPAADALKTAADEGFKSVVNMRTADEKQDVTPEEEREHAEAAGLTYLHHPVDGQKLSGDVVDSLSASPGSPRCSWRWCCSGRGPRFERGGFMRCAFGKGWPMPDLGKYAVEVGLAYGLSGMLILGLVALSVLRAGRVRRQLERVEARRHG